MRSRNIVILAVVAAALVALMWLLREPAQEQEAENLPARKAVIPSVAEDQVALLSIESFGTSTVLRHDGSRWYTDAEKKRRADADVIQRIFSTLANAPEAKLVSTSDDANQWLEFGVHPQMAPRVRMTGVNGEELVDVFIGKNPSKFDFNSTYARPASGNETYEISLPLSGLFTPPSWRNRIMLKADPKDFARVTIETTTNTITLEKQAPTTDTQTQEEGALAAIPGSIAWRMVSPQEGDVAETINMGVNTMMRYFAAQAPEDNPANLPLSAFGLEPAETTVTLWPESGAEPTVIKIGKRDFGGEMLNAMISGDSQIYLLKPDTVAFLFAEPENMLKSAEEKPSALGGFKAPDEGATTGTARETTVMDSVATPSASTKKAKSGAKTKSKPKTRAKTGTAK